MKKIIFYFLLFTTLCFPQNQEDKEKEERQNKLELILRFQDLRTVHDGKLISFLSDKDPVIRERATLAFGSIQDTSVLHLLIRNLNDRNIEVQKAAVFAIGQTATLLSQKGRRELETELIWKKLGYTQVDERLIEEIGKFGTEEALNQIMIRYGTLFPRVFINGISMSIARFAIRGIYNVDAIRYLTTFIKPELPVNWRIMYALMRISTILESHKEIMYEMHNISQLYKNPDPYVRMNLATLLGRLKAEEYLESLQKMADYDGDWRVRVNAIKALSNFNLKKNENAILTFKRSFYDGNMYIALTGLSSFANTNISDNNNSEIIKETFHWLRRIAENSDHAYRWQYQAEAAVTLAKLTKSRSLEILRKLPDSPKQLQPKIVDAFAQTGSIEAVDDIFKFSVSSDPAVLSAVLEALQQLSKKFKDDKDLIDDTYSLLINSLENRNVAVVATAAVILRDTLFLREESVDHLINTLNRLRTPDDTEAIQEIIPTLARLKNEKAVKILRKQLQQPDRGIAIAAADALYSITEKDYSKEVQTHMQPIYVDFDFEYLRALPETLKVKIETIRGDIILEIYKKYAPFTVLNFLRLAEKGYYRGTVFHRIVPNFVIQGGDPEGTGWGGPGHSIRSEFSLVSFDAGYVGMASSGKDTEGSQFFITQSPQPHLDGRYTLFGKVIKGMDKVNILQNDERVFDVKRVE